jgi:hypothetical protein
MTFEQWAEQMKKGLSFQSDEKPKAPSRYDSIPSWSSDRLDRDMDEEESTYNLSQNS